ncbi:membrane protein [Nitrincola sp. A-D6]|nr:membrane protein [Nitrincola sp. A-D6]
MRKILIVLLASFLISGCFPGVHKIDIPQGNVVTQDMIDQLRPGMTHSQVRFIMGTPLITDTFSDNRWDYLYSFQKGGSQREQERITLYFTQGQLTRFSGDFRPTAATPSE